MAKGTALDVFTPLRESNGGQLRSKPAGNGRRKYEDVTIIKAGLGNQRDRNYYPAQTLEAAVKRGYFNGLRAYADHPSSLDEEIQPERTIRDMVGVYDNPRFIREGDTGGRVVANLHLFSSARWLSSTVDDLIDLGQADKIGLSINGRGKTTERQLTLEESADPIDVNWVEDFLVLRSADVVTEAGAGGGFPQLLESATGGPIKEKAMKRLNETQQRALKAAIDAGDNEKLSALMQECGLSPAPAKPAKKTAVAEAEDDAEAEDGEAEEDGAEAEDGEAEGDAEEAEDPDAALDAEAERLKEEAGADTDDDADGNADDNEDAETQEAVAGGAGKMISGKPGGKFGGKIKGAKNSGGGAYNKPGRGQGTAQKGRKFGEAAASDPEVQRLLRENETLQERLSTTRAQLRVRTTTDRARNLLRESSIPAGLRSDVLPLMVGKSEEEMRRVIRYHERVIATAVREAGSGGSSIEDSGETRFRESHHGGDTEFGADLLEGLPLKG